jgi:hypothetical protein
MISRNLVPSKFANQFYEEFIEVLSYYQLEQKIELTEHLLNALINIEQYYKTADESFWKLYSSSEDSLVKRYGKALVPYVSKQFHHYFDFSVGLTIKGIYTRDEFNDLDSDAQTLNESEKATFFHFLKNGIRNLLQGLYLEREPEFELKKEEVLPASSSDIVTTESRLCLAVYFLLKAGFNIEPRNNKNVSQVARFTHMLRGKTWTSANNSSIYKKMRDLPEVNKGEALIKDLEFIKAYFEDLEIESALILIDAEIEKAILKLPAAKQRKYGVK